jgi:hypothetical protein
MDSWHMGDGLLTLAGRAQEDGIVDTLGSYSVDGGPQYGWRITLEPAAATLRIAMYFVEPDGQEETLGFEMVYMRG